MDDHIVIFAGGPLHNQLMAFAMPLRPCFAVDTVVISSAYHERDMYYLVQFGHWPVYFHSRLVPKNITNN